MLEYNSKLDQYTSVIYDEFSSSEEEIDNDVRSTLSVNPLLVLKRKRIISKSRSSFINQFNLSRVIRKSGRRNVFLSKLSNKNISYFRDFGNTLLSIRWRWILITLGFVNLASFLAFGALWWGLASYSGDFERNTTQPCIVNANSYTGYVLLSVETITTIGYGYRYPTEKCFGGWLVLLLQAMFSVAVQGTLVSAVYVKISKPINSMVTSIFSKNAVICLRDGRLRFVFRIHDFQSKIWCGTNISLYYMDKGDSNFNMIQMNIEPHGLLIFPLEIEHIINENSPLYKFRPLDILQARFEIIAIAEGGSTVTGQLSQKKTSYTNVDILWGHRFQPCVDFNETKQCHVVDYKKFKQTVPFDTPLCSAIKLQEIEDEVHNVDTKPEKNVK